VLSHQVDHVQFWQIYPTTEDFPQSDRIHSNLARGAIGELVFGRNEPRAPEPEVPCRKQPRERSRA
jgi:hypothetical protein